MKDFIQEHPIISVLAFFASLCVFIVAIFLLSNIGNSSSDDSIEQTKSQEFINTTPQPETGGAGTPNGQVLLLSGWDEKVDEVEIANIIPVNMQNDINQSVLKKHLSKNPTSEEFISGTISAEEAQQKQTLSLLITIDDDKYTVSYLIEEETFTIGEGI